MKKVLTAALTILAGSSAFASPLNGHSLNCETDLGQLGGIQKTEYDFFTNASGERVVRISFNGPNNGTLTDNYFVVGAKLFIALDPGHVDSQTTVFDISNPSSISRNFQYCVNPGQDGGDTRSVCEAVVEKCSLR